MSTYPAKIEAAFAKLGERDMLDWLCAHATESSQSLLVMLGLPAPPLAFRQHMAGFATEAGRYDEFVRVEAIREIWELAPSGRLGSATWPAMFEGAHLEAANAVWQRILKTSATHPAWLPAGLDDRLLAAAFAGFMFTPTEGHRRLLAIMKRIDEAWSHDNSTGSQEKGYANLQALPLGYLVVHSLFAANDEVSDGGFGRLFANSYLHAVPGALIGFALMERHDLGMLFGADERADRLDERYHAIIEKEEPGWLEAAITEKIIFGAPELFQE